MIDNVPFSLILVIVIAYCVKHKGHDLTAVALGAVLALSSKNTILEAPLNNLADMVRTGIISLIHAIGGALPNSSNTPPAAMVEYVRATTLRWVRR